MSSIRLRQEQIEKLRASGSPAAIIRFAVERWKSREIVTDFTDCKNKSKKPLQILSIHKKPEGFSDAAIRMILDSHFNNPVDRSEMRNEITELNNYIEKELSRLTDIPVIIEANQ